MEYTIPNYPFDWPERFVASVLDPRKGRWARRLGQATVKLEKDDKEDQEQAAGGGPGECQLHGYM